MTENYDDIIDLPHHVSECHPRMPISDRAAQFSPFAALTGYEDEVKEAARLTDKKIELSEEKIADLDEHLRLLEDALPQCPEAIFTYFEPDMRKAGGSYITVKGVVKRLDRINHQVILMDKTVIPAGSLLAVQSEIWNSFNR